MSDAVTLKKRGANLIGLCPFHNEKTPSFTVSPSKGIFKCFGCGESGNAVGFVMKHEQLSFPEALRHLAKRYNFELEETQATEEEKQLKDERESLFAVMNFAKQYYRDQMLETDLGRNIALSYFKSRGYTDQTIEKFGLGFAPEGFHNLLNELKAKQFDIELAKKTGLIGEKNDNLYDFFRDRVMFTIQNHTGKVVAFAGRTLRSDKKIAKYVNSAESEIYSKSRVLYGLHFAKQAISKQDQCFLVEGYTDVISLHQAGVENVVATSGTSLTTDQVKLLKRYTQNLTLLFDGDAAGLKAALRGVDLILPHDVNVKVVALPTEHDPDSFMTEKGHSGFLEYVAANEKDFILFKLNTVLEGKKNDPVKRAEAAKSVIESIALVPDGIKRSFYAHECADLLGIDEQLLHLEINKARRAEQKRQNQISARDARVQNRYEAQQVVAPLQTDQEKLLKDKTYYVEKEIVRVLLEYGHELLDAEMTVADYILFELDEQAFETPQFERIVHLYRLAEQQDKQITIEQLTKQAEEPVVQAVIEATSHPHDLSENWLEKHEIRVDGDRNEKIKEDVLFTIASFKLHCAQVLIDDKNEQLKESGDEEEQMGLLQEIMNLRDIIKQNSDQLRRNYYLH